MILITTQAVNIFFVSMETSTFGVIKWIATDFDGCSIADLQTIHEMELINFICVVVFMKIAPKGVLEKH